MQTINIMKKSGGTRKIYVPSRSEKQALRDLLPSIPQPAGQLMSAHGFREGRSPVTNALAHVKNYVPGAIMISCDLSDFFGRVTPAQVSAHLPATRREEILAACFPDGAAQQGLPTSPALANLAGIAIDEAIRRKIKKSGWRATYTRYADDLSISFPEPPECGTETVITAVDEIVRRCGHQLNQKKTRVQAAKAGRWECCGVMVDSDGVYITRRQRRLLRALEHNAQKPGADKKTRQRAAGLREWAQLKKPVTPEEKRAREQARAAAIARTWAEEAAVIAEKICVQTADAYHALTPDIHLAEGATITQDPVMIYGMSHLTTGWTSCMDAQRHAYDYCHGVEFWRRLRGISIAYVPDRKMTWHGAIRPAMKERAIIYALRDGRKAFGLIYPAKNYDGYRLGRILRDAGYAPARECHGALVEGHVVEPCPKPYFDIGGIDTVTLSESRARACRVKL